MRDFFNSVLNTLVRDLPRWLQITIAFVFFAVALFSLYKTLRRKNDTHPIAVGWLILFIVSMFMSIVYIVF